MKPQDNVEVADYRVEDKSAPLYQGWHDWHSPLQHITLDGAPAPMTAWRLVALGALFAAALAAAGCNDGNGDAEAGSVRGVVVQVEARSLTELGFLDVREDSGFVWRFQPGSSYRGFTPSHLREHMVQGLGVTVVYHSEDGVLLIDDITD